MYNEEGYPSIQAFYGPYDSLQDAIDYFTQVVKEIIDPVPGGIPIGIINNGQITQEYVFKGGEVVEANFIPRLITISQRAILDSLVEIVEDGGWNVNSNMQAIGAPGNSGGGGASSQDVQTLQQQMSKVIDILGGLYTNSKATDGKFVIE